MRVIIDNEGVVSEAVTMPRTYEQRNEALKKYINSFPLVIDRAVFKKTKKEKELVNKVKLQFKNRQKD